MDIEEQYKDEVEVEGGSQPQSQQPIFTSWASYMYKKKKVKKEKNSKKQLRNASHQKRWEKKRQNN